LSWIRDSRLFKKPAVSLNPGSFLAITNGKECAVYKVLEITDAGGVLVINLEAADDRSLENKKAREPETDRQTVPAVYPEQLHAC
jgi:hypothetical protein